MSSRLLIRVIPLSVISFVVIGIALHFAMARVATGPLRSLIEANLSEAFGLDVELDEVSIAVIPSPSLDATGIRVALPPDRSQTYLIEIEQIELEFKLWPLIARRFVIDDISIVNADIHLDASDKARIVDASQLEKLVEEDPDDDDSLDFELRQVVIEGLRIFYDDGSDRPPRALVLDAISLNASDLGRRIAFDARGQFEGSPIEVAGKVGSLRQLMDAEQTFPVEIQGQIFEASFEAAGSVREVDSLSGIDLKIAAEIPELSVSGRALPQFGRLSFTGELSDEDGSLGFESLRIDSIGSEAIQIDVSGKIDDLLALEEIDVEGRLQSGPVKFLAPFLQPRFEVPVSAIAAVSVQAKLSHEKDGLVLDAKLRSSTRDDGVQLTLEGEIRNFLKNPKLNATVQVDAEDLRSITEFMPEAPIHGPFGPLRARSRLQSQGDGLSASGIELRLGGRDTAWVEMDGSIANVAALRDVDLHFTFGAASLHHLQDVVARELPTTSRLEGSAAVHDKRGRLALGHFRLHGGEDGPVEIHLDARLDELAGSDQIEIDVGLKGEDARVLGALAGYEMPPLGPIEFEGRVTGSTSQVQSEKMRLRVGQTQLDGTLSGEFATDTRPRIRARLSSHHVRLSDLGLTPDASTPLRPESKSGSASDTPTDSSLTDELPFEVLHDIDLDLKLQFDRVEGYAGFDGRDVRLSLELDDGELDVKDMTATYKGGKLNSSLKVDASKPTPELELDFHATDIDVARVTSQFDADTNYSGIADIDIDLTARGNRLPALRQSLGGHFGLSIQNGNVASRIAREFVVNLVEVAFSRRLDSKTPSYGCGIFGFDIENGIATVRSFYLAEEELSIAAAGQIDLVEGTYDLHVVPKTTNPGILSVAPEVRVTGPLEAPVFEPVKRTFATSFGRGLFKNTVKAGKFILWPFGWGNAKDGAASEACRMPSRGENSDGSAR